MDAVVQPPNRLELYRLFTKLEFVRLIDRYGLRGAELEEVSKDVPVQKTASLPRVDEMPGDVGECAVYIAGDGSLGLAWDSGVCVMTPLEVQMAGLDLSGKRLALHDSKSTMHRLDELGISFGECVFDTALAAYDLVAHREIGLKKVSGGCSFEVNTAPGDGKLVLLLDRKIEKLSIQTPAVVKRGEKFSVVCRIADAANKPFKACLPVEVTLTAANGTKLPGNGFYAMTDGLLKIHETMATNAPVGKVKLQLRCLASGKKAETILEVR
jgi:hypothetical protein